MREEQGEKKEGGTEKKLIADKLIGARRERGAGFGQVSLTGEPLAGFCSSHISRYAWTYEAVASGSISM